MTLLTPVVVTAVGHRLALRPGVACEIVDESIVLGHGRARLRLRNSTGSRHLLERLAHEGGTRADLVRDAEESSTPLAACVLLDRLDRLGWLSYSLRIDGEAGSVITAHPVQPTTDLGASRQAWSPYPTVTGTVRLSRFAHARWTEDGMVLSSPLSNYEVRAQGSLLAEVLSSLPGDPASVANWDVVDLLHRARMTSRLPDRPTDESEDDVLRQWEFHDLLFHVHTRDGRRDRPFGGTFRFDDTEEGISPLPAVHPSYEGDVRELDVPADDPTTPGISLVEALRERRSIRRHGEPIRLADLSDFLYRSAHTEMVDDSGPTGVSRRPYPGGGGIHELEVYVVARACAGLEPGVYHYRAAQHALCRVADMGQAADLLLDDAAWSMAHPRPQVLIVITSRFQRIAWKYEAIAYALTLKHVGCLLQTMYLTATGLGLAPCAIGGGDSEVFARTVGLPSLAESSVGELALGMPADPDGP